eukprot:TRINITY_DN960_c0_g1_i3.p1 TRINITY_DN960_c0_g1~~TRINITY_DN960_c0_g1_i3.p1  ORF type:complete len:437 (+),score=83.10 TRINITY_DN960_c0_g1_i3:66-1376(+)
MANIIQELRFLQNTDFDINDEEHKYMLENIWNTFFEETMQIPHQNWKILGFQNINPVSDIRGSGVFGIIQFEYLCTNYKEEVIQMVNNNQPRTIETFPFASAALNISFKLINEKKINNNNNNDNEEKEREKEIIKKKGKLKLVNNKLDVALNVRRSGANSVRMGISNKIMIFGGNKFNFRLVSEVEIFDTTTNTCTTLCIELNTPRYNAASCYCNNKIYIFGGVSKKKLLDSIEYYDDKFKKWIESPTTLNSPRDACTVNFYDGYVYLIGGEDKYNKLDTIEIYDPFNNVWLDEVYHLNIARAYHTSCIVDNKLFVIGGINNSGSSLNSMEIFDIKEKKISIGQSLRFPRATHQSAIYKGNILVFGGSNRPSLTNPNIEIYNLKTRKFKQVHSTINRNLSTSTIINNNIYMFGGYDSENIHQSSIEVINLPVYLNK